MASPKEHRSMVHRPGAIIMAQEWCPTNVESRTTTSPPCIWIPTCMQAQGCPQPSTRVAFGRTARTYNPQLAAAQCQSCFEVCVHSHGFPRNLSRQRLCCRQGCETRCYPATRGETKPRMSWYCCPSLPPFASPYALPGVLSSVVGVTCCSETREL